MEVSLQIDRPCSYQGLPNHINAIKIYIHDAKVLEYLCFFLKNEMLLQGEVFVNHKVDSRKSLLILGLRSLLLRSMMERLATIHIVFEDYTMKAGFQTKEKKRLIEDYILLFMMWLM